MKLDPSAFVASPELLQALEERATAISCDGDRILFRQGDIPTGLYILGEGEITLTMTSPTGEQVLSFKAHAGSLLGLPGLISDEPYTLSAIARKSAQLRFISRDEITDLMQTDPRLALKMLEVLAAEVQSARHALSNL
jgi:CRP-like cAMP-binding protein